MQVLPDAHWTYAVLLHAKPSWTWPLLQSPLHQLPSAPLSSSMRPSPVTDAPLPFSDNADNRQPHADSQGHGAECVAAGDSDQGSPHKQVGPGHFVLSRQSASPRQSSKQSQHHRAPESRQHSLLQEACSPKSSQARSMQLNGGLQPSNGSLLHSVDRSDPHQRTSAHASKSAAPAAQSDSDSNSAAISSPPAQSPRPSGAAAPHGSEPDPPREADGNAGMDGSSSKLLFSGFVSFSQLQQQHLHSQAARAQQARFRGGFRSKASLAFAWRPPWLDQGQSSPQPTRVKMTGPGSQGFAEVAVTWLPRSNTHAPHEQSQPSDECPVPDGDIRFSDEDTLDGKGADSGSTGLGGSSHPHQKHAHEGLPLDRAPGRRHGNPVQHTNRKHSSGCSVSSEWVPVEKPSPEWAIEGDPESKFARGVSKLWSYAASKLPPSLTGVP